MELDFERVSFENMVWYYQDDLKHIENRQGGWVGLSPREIQSLAKRRILQFNGKKTELRLTREARNVLEGLVD